MVLRCHLYVVPTLLVAISSNSPLFLTLASSLAAGVNLQSLDGKEKWIYENKTLVSRGENKGRWTIGVSFHIIPFFHISMSRDNSITQMKVIAKARIELI